MTSIPILAAVMIQYQAITAPVLVPVQASTNGGGPSPLTAALPTIQYQAMAAPVVVPSQVVSPVTGASPVYPSRVFPRRRLHASQHPFYFADRFAAPTVVAAPDLPPTTNVDVRRRPWPHAIYTQYQPEFGVPTEVPVMSWTGHYPDTLPQFKKRTHARYMPALFWDLVLVPDVVVAPDEAVPVYPDRIYRTPKLRQYPLPSWPPFVADATVVAPNHAWDPCYPDRLYPRQALAARFQQAFAMWPSPVPVVAVSDVTGPHRFRVPAHNRTFRVPSHARRFRT